MIGFLELKASISLIKLPGKIEIGLYENLTFYQIVIIICMIETQIILNLPLRRDN